MDQLDMWLIAITIAIVFIGVTVVSDPDDEEK